MNNHSRSYKPDRCTTNFGVRQTINSQIPSGLYIGREYLGNYLYIHPINQISSYASSKMQVYRSESISKCMYLLEAEGNYLEDSANSYI